MKHSSSPIPDIDWHNKSLKGYNNLLKRYNMRVVIKDNCDTNIYIKNKLILTIDSNYDSYETLVMVLLRIKPMFYGIMDSEVKYISPSIYKLLNLKSIKIDIDKGDYEFTRILIYNPKQCKYSRKQLIKIFKNVTNYHYEIGQMLGFPKKAIEDFCNDNPNKVKLSYFGFTLAVSKENYKCCLEELKNKYKIPIILRV